MHVLNPENLFRRLERMGNLQDCISRFFTLVKIMGLVDLNQTLGVEHAFVSNLILSYKAIKTYCISLIYKSLLQFRIIKNTKLFVTAGTHCTDPPHPPLTANLRITGWDGTTPVPIGEVF